MDSDNTQNTQAGAERSSEEVAWDEEFVATGKTSDGMASTLSDLAKLAVQVPTALVEMSSFMFPEDARRHARAAARESFLTVRSLLGAVGDGIEQILAEPGTGGKKQVTVSGPEGTWGTARAAGTTGAGTGAQTSAKAKRIELSDGDDTPGSTESRTEGASTDGSDLPEGRGLRADIDY